MVQVYDMLGVLKDTGTASGISTSAFPPVGTEAVIYTQYSGAAIDNVEIRSKSLFGIPSELSMASGGTQSLAINFGPSHAGELYLLLGSTSGTTPATPAGPGIHLPLATDSYLIYTLQNPNSPPLTGSFGSLSASGTASATFTLPTAFDPGLVGVTLHHAAVAFDLTGGLTVTGATEAVAVTFNP
jgi:hypothetical protein